MSNNVAKTEAGAGMTAKQVKIWRSLSALGMLPVLLILAVGFHFASDGLFFTAQNMSIVSQQAAINIVLAAGMTFVILTGGIDLSVGSILAASAMAAVIVSLDPTFAPVAVAAGLGVGLFFGAVNGGLIAGIGLPPFIVTLGLLTAVRGLARWSGNDNTVMNPELSFSYIGNSQVAGIPVLAIIAALVILVSWFILRRTILGVWIYAVGGNPAAARLSGIKVGLVLVFVYCYSGLLSGLGGIMAAARLYSANGLQIGQGYELDAIAAVILGGTSFVGGIGSIWGTLIGALIIAVLTNGLVLVGVSEVWQLIIKGLVIVCAVALDRYRNRNASHT